MIVEKQIRDYLHSLPEAKRTEMETLHSFILKHSPDLKLWFLDGRDENNKVVSNPNIGYGSLKMKYADGKTKEFYRVGISANSTGISVYIMGIEDKNYLMETFGATIGKATVTGYCIKFKKNKDIDLATLQSAITYGLQTNR
ncbi:MAG: DUF1801 domain-containing protein [Flavitalea sp.]